MSNWGCNISRPISTSQLMLSRLNCPQWVANWWNYYGFFLWILMQVMGCYNNIWITVIIIIHVINFKGWQDDSMAVIGEKINTQHGNYQMPVMFWSVYGYPSWFEGHSNCISVFFSSPQCYSRIQMKNTLTCMHLCLLQWEWKCKRSKIPKK